jgi:Pathogenicity locus
MNVVVVRKTGNLQPPPRTNRSNRRKRPVLSLTTRERSALRRAHLTAGDLAREPPENLAQMTSLPLSRCKNLCASALFQTLSSVGPSIAADIVALGYTSLDGLAKADPAQMYLKFSRKVGRKVDPCVEDVFRCAVAQARDPSLPESARNWWYWLPYRGTNVVAPQNR